MSQVLDKDGTTTRVHDSKLRLAPPKVMDTEDQLEAVRAAVRAVGGLGVGGRVEFSSTAPGDLCIRITRGDR